MTNIELALPDELDRFVRKQVASGAYASATEVVADALRRLAAEAELQAQDRLELLRQALRPGLDDIAAGRLSDRGVRDFMQDAKTRK